MLVLDKDRSKEIKKFRRLLSEDERKVINTERKALFLANVLGVACFINLYYGILKYNVNLLILENNFINNIVEDNYDCLSDNDKCNYVVEFFCDCIDKNTFLSPSYKDEVKNKLTPFFRDWGYLYDRDDLYRMAATIPYLGVSIDPKLSDRGVAGLYHTRDGNIGLDDHANSDTLAHEVVHAVTVDRNILFDYSSFVLEGMNSSYDLYYNDHYSYTSEHRKILLLLGELVGQENLIKCFINSARNSDLIPLIGNNELLNLFRAHEEYKNNHKISEETVYNIVDVLTNLYENKYGKSMTEDFRANFIRLACLSPSGGVELYNYSIFSKDNVIKWLFKSDDYSAFYSLDFSDKRNLNCRCSSIYDYCCLSILNEIRDDFYDTSYDYNVYFFRILFGDDKFFAMLNSNDVLGEFKKALCEIGFVDDIDQVLYCILHYRYNKDDVLCCGILPFNYFSMISNCDSYIAIADYNSFDERDLVNLSYEADKMENSRDLFANQFKTYFRYGSDMVYVHYFSENNEIVLPSGLNCDYVFYNVFKGNAKVIEPISIIDLGEYRKYVFDKEFGSFSANVFYIDVHKYLGKSHEMKR